MIHKGLILPTVLAWGAIVLLGNQALSLSPSPWVVAALFAALALTIAATIKTLGGAWRPGLIVGGLVTAAVFLAWIMGGVA